MTIFVLGSINIDTVYRVPELPRPGETVSGTLDSVGLGGKGANQAVALARAGARVRLVGAIGHGTDWVCDTLAQAGIDLSDLRRVDAPTGQAMICIDQAGENTIVIIAGANHWITPDQVTHSLKGARQGDWLLLQNETNLGPETAKLARRAGLKVCYSAAPFSAAVVREVLPFTDLLVVNEIEDRMIADLIPDAAALSPGLASVVTMGKEGAIWRQGEHNIHVPAFPVTPTDTVGAGDTFLGFLLAGIERGETIETAMRKASAAAAIKISRRGAATMIPRLDEVTNYLRDLK